LFQHVTHYCGCFNTTTTIISTLLRLFQHYTTLVSTLQLYFNIIIIIIFYCRLMVHITDTRAQKVFSYTSAHITEAKHFILTTAVSSFTRAQKMDNHTVAHHTTGVSMCPTLRGAKRFPSTSYFFMLGVYTAVHIFLPYKSNTDEMQIPKQLTNNYCIRSPPYRSIE